MRGKTWNATAGRGIQRLAGPAAAIPAARLNRPNHYTAEPEGHVELPPRRVCLVDARAQTFIWRQHYISPPATHNEWPRRPLQRELANPSLSRHPLAIRHAWSVQETRRRSSLPRRRVHTIPHAREATICRLRGRRRPATLVTRRWGVPREATEQLRAPSCRTLCC